jgi:hypothetical protein
MARDEDWRRFGFTVQVVLAAAQAQEGSMALLQGIGRERFAFRLLAAAVSERATLPIEGWFDATRRLRATCTVNGGEIRLQFQAEGFAALRRVAGRSARLAAKNGSFDVAIDFDGDGRALAVLADSDAVQQGLQFFQLLLDTSR